MVTVVCWLAAGVPEIMPVGFRLRPVGKVPVATAKEYGAVPPATGTACEYAIPAMPGGREFEVKPRCEEDVLPVEKPQPVASNKRLASTTNPR